MNGFSPQLIGQTEKALDALLGQVLLGTGLTERQWVALRLTGQADGSRPVADVLRDDAHVADADDLLGTLATAGLVTDGQLTDAGRRLIDTVGQRVAAHLGPVWHTVDPADLVAAERALTAVRDGVREVLASLPSRAA